MGIHYPDEKITNTAKNGTRPITVRKSPRISTTLLTENMTNTVKDLTTTVEAANETVYVHRGNSDLQETTKTTMADLILKPLFRWHEEK